MPPENMPSDAAQQQTYTAFPAKVQKQEAVFANLGADGTVQSIRVTDRLTTDRGEVQVHDISTLRDIRNLKGSEIPIRDGVELTWHMPTTQLYYTGTTDKTLPVVLSIRYFLNGTQSTPDKMRGKAGSVRIEVRAFNTTSGDAFVPFLLAGGTILGTDATQIAVDSGGSVGDGSRELVFGLLLPGMADALGLDAGSPLFAQYFTITYHTEQYEPGSLYFALLPVSAAALGDVMQSAFGAEQLPQTDFSPLLSQIRRFGEDEDLAAFLRQAADSTALFQTAQNAMQAYSREQPLLDVLLRYLTPENAALLQETIESLSGATLSEYAALLQNPLFISLMADMGTVSGAFSRLIPTLSAMIADLQTQEVRTAIAALPDTMMKLQALSDALAQNAQWLDALSAFSQSGGLTQMETLLQSVQSVTQSGVLETLQSLAGKADALEQKLNAVLQAGKEYGIFTSASKDAETSVYFVLKVS